MFWSDVLLAALALGTSTARAGSLADVEHVILFMQENRACEYIGG
jgi:phospholipase C